MSADNWAVCPRCEVKRQQTIEAEEQRVANAYGSVDVDDFLAMRTALRALKAQEPEHTLREDYEFYGVEEGVVHAEYSAGCGFCGLRVEFKHEHPFDVGGAS